jgi:ABC-type branched-subunit amino acid transport system ATPase component
MNQGQVIAIGTSAEVQSHPEVIKAYIGSEDEDAHGG